MSGTAPANNTLPDGCNCASEIASLTSMINGLTTNINTLGGIVSGTQNSLTSIQSTQASINTMLTNVQNSITNLQTQIASLQQVDTTLQNEILVLQGATPPPAVPNAATGLTSTGVTTTTVSLSWTAPVTGPAVTSYQVQFALAGTGAFAEWTDSRLWHDCDGYWTDAEHVIRLPGDEFGCCRSWSAFHRVHD